MKTKAISLLTLCLLMSCAEEGQLQQSPDLACVSLGSTSSSSTPFHYSLKLNGIPLSLTEDTELESSNATITATQQGRTVSVLAVDEQQQISFEFELEQAVPDEVLLEQLNSSQGFRLLSQQGEFGQVAFTSFKAQEILFHIEQQPNLEDAVTPWGFQQKVTAYSCEAADSCMRTFVQEHIQLTDSDTTLELSPRQAVEFEGYRIQLTHSRNRLYGVYPHECTDITEPQRVYLLHKMP